MKFVLVLILIDYQAEVKLSTERPKTNYNVAFDKKH